MYQPTKNRGKLSVVPKEPQMLGLTFQPVTSGGGGDKYQKQREGLRGSRDMLSTSNLLQRSPSAELVQNLQLAADRKHFQPPRSAGHAAAISPVSRTAAAVVQRNPVVGNPAHAFDLLHVSDNTRYSSPVSQPGDSVQFSSRIVTISRSNEEKAANPDRLNLDRRQLTACPVLEGEEHLRLLNYQHNLISRIDNLHQFTRLIYLDLYDNRITAISGLENLRALRVLMLGKNRISKIQNLEELTKLDVLDLHGNEILCIENLNHLTELRVLNLACNKIEEVNNLQGMDALAEVNLRRNNIRTVIDVDTLPCLQRLFLSYNEIAAFEDISCLSDSRSLLEVSLDGNPLALDPQYRQTVLRNMLQLKHFDMKKVTDEERRYATVIARKEEEKRREQTKAAMLKERRKAAITSVQRQWEMMQQSSGRGRGQRMPDLVASHVGNVANSEFRLDDTADDMNTTNTGRSRPTSAASQLSEAKISSARPAILQPVSIAADKRATLAKPLLATAPLLPLSPTAQPSSPGYMCEISGDVLNVFGTGALEAFDRNWGLQAAGVVTTVHFKFTDFDVLSRILHKIRVRFPNVQTAIFGSANLHSLQQLNALAALRRLDNIVVESESNPITRIMSWRFYALFRLAHFSLKKINYIEVSSADIIGAEKYFGQLAHLTSQLNKTKMAVLLGDKKRNTQDDSKRPIQLPAADARVLDKSVEPASRAVLTYTPPDTILNQVRQKRADFANQWMRDVASAAISSWQRRAESRVLWPHLLTSVISDTVSDMWDLQAYMKRSLDSLEKSVI